LSKAITKKLEAGLQITKMDDILLLTKFRLSLTVVISSVLAYLVSAKTGFSISNLSFLFIGGLAVTGAANGVNQVLEREFDGMMERTKNRPLPSNRMKSSEAVLISGLMLVFGTIVLGLINPLTAFLGMSSFVLYAFLYTPLKRYSTLSVAIGAIPGALPVLIGVVANEGTITMLGVTLFLVQFLWQFPHFWAISYLSFDDYDKAGYKLLPKNSDGTIDKNLGAYAALYSFLIIPTVIWSYYMEVSTGIISLMLIIIATLIYTWLGIQLQLKPSRKTALTLMFSSFIIYFD